MTYSSISFFSKKTLVKGCLESIKPCMQTFEEKFLKILHQKITEVLRKRSIILNLRTNSEDAGISYCINISRSTAIENSSISF